MHRPTRPDHDVADASAVLAFTQCAYCGQVMPQMLAFATRVNGDEEHYCNERCANEHSLERLRECGL